MRSRRLVWLPVVLLPLSNLIVARATRAALTISAAWILGAVAEELFFRFLLLRQVFLRTMKPVFAVLLVSVLFAVMHLFNLRAGQPFDQVLAQAACAFGFSIWAGAATWKATWLIPLLAHVLLNATATGEGHWVSLAVGAWVLACGLALMREDGIL